MNYRTDAIIRTIEIFMRYIQPNQKVIYLAEASGPVAGKQIGDLALLTYIVGMGGETESLSFTEMITVFDYIFGTLDKSAEAVRTGKPPPNQTFDVDRIPDGPKILSVLPRIRLTHSHPS